MSVAQEVGPSRAAILKGDQYLTVGEESKKPVSTTESKRDGALRGPTATSGAREYWPSPRAGKPAGVSISVPCSAYRGNHPSEFRQAGRESCGSVRIAPRRMPR